MRGLLVENEIIGGLSWCCTGCFVILPTSFRTFGRSELTMLDPHFSPCLPTSAQARSSLSGFLEGTSWSVEEERSLDLLGTVRSRWLSTCKGNGRGCGKMEGEFEGWMNVWISI